MGRCWLAAQAVVSTGQLIICNSLYRALDSGCSCFRELQVQLFGIVSCEQLRGQLLVRRLDPDGQTDVDLLGVGRPVNYNLFADWQYIAAD